MYLQITDKCNMTCEHCAFACTMEGTFMELETVRKALEIYTRDGGGDFTIGGGEPCLHPQFETIITMIIAHMHKKPYPSVPFIVVNGSFRKRALWLLELAEQNLIKPKLSYDQFHNMKMVHPSVVDAYRKHKWLWGPNAFTDQETAAPFRNTDGLVAVGRAVQFTDARKECACPTYMVKPSGEIKQCGCIESPVIGSVFTGGIYPQFPKMPSRCHNSYGFREAMADKEREKKEIYA